MSRYSLRRQTVDAISSKENLEANSNSSIESSPKSRSVQTRNKRTTKRTGDEDVLFNTKVGASPPKSSKKNVPVSPNKGIEDLEENVVKELKRKEKTVYQKARQALTFNQNYNLPGREAELEKLSKFIHNKVESKTSGSLYISGPPGTGKTACLTKIINTKEYHKQLRMVYVNCTSISSAGNVYDKICTELDIKSSGHTEKDYVAAIEHYLTHGPKTTMLVLDEIDQLVGKNQSILYRIFEWPSWKSANLILIGIANSLDLTDRLLIRLQTKCELKPDLLHFASYTKEQIIEIFKQRLQDSNVLDLFPPATIQLLAAKVSAVSGDIRRALDIGRRVIEIAEKEMSKSDNLNGIDFRKIDITTDLTKPLTVNDEKEEKTDKPIQLKEVMTVINKVYGVSQTLDEDIDVGFPLQQKILVCSLLLIIKKEKFKDVTVGRLHDVYRKVCSKRNILAIDQTEFNNLCSLVETRGIIRMQTKKEPRLNRIILQWDEEEVTAALKDKQLITAILNDFSCLAK